MTGPRTSILSGSIGSGHNSVAQVCASALRAAGSQVEIVDCIEGLGGPGRRIGEFAFRRMLDHPPVLDAMHFSQLRAASKLSDAMERASARQLTKFLTRRSVARAELLLSVFATGAGAAGRLRQRDDALRTVVFCTDATAHRLWIHPGIERYLVCSSMAASSVLQYDPAADIVELPPPLRAPFFSVPDKADARARLGFHSHQPVVLLMAGGWGLGSLVDMARTLAEGGHAVAAVAGANRRVEARLRREAAMGTFSGSIIPFGYTNQMPELMAAADVIVTTPGQTCHEARAVGRPLVVMDAVPGHGRENLLLEMSKGGALACSSHPAAVAAAVSAALRDKVRPAAPWPIETPSQWDDQFMKAIDDLMG